MTTTAQRRPVTTIRPAPIAPQPAWEAHRVFQEPTYLDGQPYTNDHEDDEPEAA